jgi:uncharacterized membrane protein
MIGSLWFVPSLLLSLGVGAALLLIDLHTRLDLNLGDDWPRLFGAGAEGARSMLSAIATSMITVAGVVFSITIVVLTLTASQYSPRVLRNFMSDHPTQIVLGAFVAIFAYCLIVLRTIRGEGENAYVPSLAVLGGVLMAFVGIGLLIYFVHHVASAIQVSFIVKRIASETSEVIDRLFPADVGRENPPDAPVPRISGPDAWEEIAATSTGYLVAVDGKALLQLVAERQTLLQLLPQIGQFVIAGTVVARVAPGGETPPGGWPKALAGCLDVQSARTVDQDVAFGMQQLVDVALKALSPSLHDPSTAINCIDHLTALLHRLSGRHIESGLRQQDGRLRLMLSVAGYEDIVRVALSAVTHHAGSHEPVHDRILTAVECAATATAEHPRLAVLGAQLDAHLARLAEADLPPASVQTLRRRATTLRNELRRRERTGTASEAKAMATTDSGGCRATASP